MEFSYDFEGYFNYSVEYEDAVEALLLLFSRNYDIDIKLVKMLYNDDWLKFDRLKYEFYEEAREYFKQKAYKQYIDERFA